MTKKIEILSITVILLLLFILVFSNVFLVNAISPFIETPDLSIEDFAKLQTCHYNITIIKEYQEAAHQMAESARKLGYAEDGHIITTAKQHWAELEKEKNIHVNELSNWVRRFDEHPYATYIWLYLTDTLGYNDYVAAGILGNIIAECGGGTLDIQYWAYSSGFWFYGMCQWSKQYFPEIQGANLIEQCEFLANTIEQNMNTFSQAYDKNKGYDYFLTVKSEKVAAKMFAQLYEACDSSSYSIRQQYATTAYNYFVGNQE